MQTKENNYILQFCKNHHETKYARWEVLGKVSCSVQNSAINALMHISPDLLCI